MNDILGTLLPYALVAGWVGVQAIITTAWHRAHAFHRAGMDRLARMK